MIDWDSYRSLREDLAKQRDVWQHAATYADFRQAIDAYAPGLREGDYGLDKLEAAVTDEVRDPDTAYQQIRAWAIPAVASPEAGQQASTQPTGLTPDQESGLLYDASNWYLPDGTTVVTPVDGTDLYQDAARTRYRRGTAVQWYDKNADLMYDAASWYLADGTVVTPVEGTDLYQDAARTRYRRGTAVQWYDGDANLRYDAASWYLPDGTTIVTAVEGTDLYQDGAGQRYRHGELVAQDAPPVQATAEETLVAQLATAREQKLAEVLATLEEAGWEPADSEQEAAERRAEGDEAAMTMEQLIGLFDQQVEQLLGS